MMNSSVVLVGAVGERVVQQVAEPRLVGNVVGLAGGAEVGGVQAAEVAVEVAVRRCAPVGVCQATTSAAGRQKVQLGVDNVRVVEDLLIERDVVVGIGIAHTAAHSAPGRGKTRWQRTKISPVRGHETEEGGVERVLVRVHRHEVQVVVDDGPRCWNSCL